MKLNKKISLIVLICCFLLSFSVTGITYFTHRPSAIKTAVFTGDSITAYCDLTKYYPDYETVNTGIPGDTANGVYNRLENSVYSHDPDIVVLHVGFNDIRSGLDITVIADNIFKITRDIQVNLPKAKLYVQSVYPCLDSDELIVTAKIQELNSVLISKAEEENYIFINEYDLLKIEDGRINALYTYDGVHPNELGYEIVSEEVNRVLSRKR